MQVTALMLGGGDALLAVLALVLGLLVLVALVRRRSASRAPADQVDEPEPMDELDEATETHEAIETAEPVEPADPEDGPVQEPPATVLSPSVLTAYVRTLEATLAEQDQRLHEVTSSADRLLSETRERQAERVQCTLLAMRERLTDQPGDVVLNRVETALARLGSTRTARPLLPADPSGCLPIAFAAVRDRSDVGSVPAPQAEVEAGAPESPTDPDPYPAPDDADPEPTVEIDTAPDLREIDAPVVLHRVLPVPAPVPAATTSRSRRRFGRKPVS